MERGKSRLGICVDYVFEEMAKLAQCYVVYDVRSRSGGDTDDQHARTVSPQPTSKVPAPTHRAREVFH